MSNPFPNRKLNRYSNFDYSTPGYYFITICVQNFECVFGEIIDGKMVLNECGTVVETCWNRIPNHFPHISLDDYIIMPNHVHGILVIDDATVGNIQTPCQTRWGKTLSSAIRGFKIGVTKSIHKNHDPLFAWQKSYYDHIVRNDQSLRNIRQYIRNNPNNWQRDRNNKNIT